MERQRYQFETVVENGLCDLNLEEETEDVNQTPKQLHFKISKVEKKRNVKVQRKVKSASQKECDKK